MRSPRGGARARSPQWRRVELRYVDLKAGRRLQVTRYDATQAFTANHAAEAAAETVDALLAEPFGNWHVEATTRRSSSGSRRRATSRTRCTARR